MYGSIYAPETGCFVWSTNSICHARSEKASSTGSGGGTFGLTSDSDSRLAKKSRVTCQKKSMRRSPVSQYSTMRCGRVCSELRISPSNSHRIFRIMTSAGPSTNGKAPAASAISLSQEQIVSEPNPCVSCKLTLLDQNKFKPARIFKGSVEPAPAPSPSAYRSQAQGPRHITGITFDDRGDYLVTAAEDETFRLYSCKSGK